MGIRTKLSNSSDVKNILSLECGHAERIVHSIVSRKEIDHVHHNLFSVCAPSARLDIPGIRSIVDKSYLPEEFSQSIAQLQRVLAPTSVETRSL